MGLRQDPRLPPHIPGSKSPSRPLLAMGQAPIQGSPEAQSPEVLPLSLAHMLLPGELGPSRGPRPRRLTIWGLPSALPVVGTKAGLGSQRLPAQGQALSRSPGPTAVSGACHPPSHVPRHWLACTHLPTATLTRPVRPASSLLSTWRAAPTGTTAQPALLRSSTSALRSGGQTSPP